MNTLAYVKLGIVGVVVLGGFVLVALGRLDAAQMYGLSGTTVGALVIALGLNQAGTSIADKMK